MGRTDASDLVNKHLDGVLQLLLGGVASKREADALLGSLLVPAERPQHMGWLQRTRAARRAAARSDASPIQRNQQAIGWHTHKAKMRIAR